MQVGVVQWELTGEEREVWRKEEVEICPIAFGEAPCWVHTQPQWCCVGEEGTDTGEVKGKKEDRLQVAT